MITWFWQKVPSAPCWSIFHRQNRSDINKQMRWKTCKLFWSNVFQSLVKILILLPNFFFFFNLICENLLVYQENFPQPMFLFNSYHNLNILITWILFLLFFSDATTWEYEGQFWWSQWSWTVCLPSKLLFVSYIKLERLFLTTDPENRVVSQGGQALSWVFSDISYQSKN